MIPERNPQAAYTLPYFRFIWQKRQRTTLLGGIGVSILLYVIFKTGYPYPDFFGDSYSYIYAADQHLDINIWPIGYSKFLCGFHTLTYSSRWLIAFQYFATQMALLHFLFTLLYFFEVKGWHRRVLEVFLLVNPFTLYLMNTINSDALFGLLSILWITGLIWIIQCPRKYQILTQAILLSLCFTVRNAAYYYPIVTAIAFLLSKQGLYRKWVGIATPCVLILPFILFTREASYKLTKTRQFSLFTGWQLANNALYFFDQVDVDSTDFSTAQSRTLYRYSVQFFRRVQPEALRDALDNYTGNFFIRQPEAPLKQYYAAHYTFTGERSNIINWANASEAFEPFGKTLILQHPFAYAQFFVIPNIKHYLFSPLSHIGLYNYGLNEIDPIAAKWFHYPSNKIWVVSHELQGSIMLLYVGLFLLLNVFYLRNIIRFAFSSKWSNWRQPAFSAQLLVLGFVLLNFGFSVTTTANILRYQYIPMLVMAGFGLTLEYSLHQII